MIKKVLVANRGEIAVRIIRAAAELQIKTVAVYSTADRDALHVKLADEAVCIGAPPSRESYLQAGRLLTVAQATGCDAVHPGYGFLSENAAFAEAVTAAGLTFIGPPADVIRQMGDKALARQCMQANGVPVVPGSDGVVANVEEAARWASQLGYPVLLKAAAGGGGKGMRRVYDAASLAAAFQEAQSEAAAAFDCGDLYVEKLILRPRHVEVQVLADSCGQAVALGERNCSVQLDNQKMIEESPCPGLSDAARTALTEAALAAVRASGYVNAGTVEFVVDDAEAIYFIEMNTRIQVEHPVTEMVTGVDLVKEQFRIAAGLHLAWSQQEVTSRGHAIECRVVARDPRQGFAPQCGTVSDFYAPGGVDTRCDTHLYNGATVSPYYDALLAKIIVHDKNRLQAMRKMRRALEETVIAGVATNLDLLYTILHDFDFVRGRYDTSFVDERLDDWLDVMEATTDELLRAAQKDI